MTRVDIDRRCTTPGRLARENRGRAPRHPGQFVQETLVDGGRQDDEEVVHRVPSWPITTGRALSGPSRGICRDSSAASRLPPTPSTLPYRLNGIGEPDLLFSRSQ